MIARREIKRLDLRSEVAQHKQADRRTEIDALRPLAVDRVDQVDRPLVAGLRDLMKCAPKLILQADAGLLAAKVDRTLAHATHIKRRIRVSRINCHSATSCLPTSAQIVDSGVPAFVHETIGEADDAIFTR
jgi:hypothetical protein